MAAISLTTTILPPLQAISIPAEIKTTTTMTTPMLSHTIIPDRQLLTPFPPSTPPVTQPPVPPPTLPVTQLSTNPPQAISSPTTTIKMELSTITLTTVSPSIKQASTVVPDRQIINSAMSSSTSPSLAPFSTTLSSPDRNFNSMFSTSTPFFQNYTNVSITQNIFGNATSILCGFPGTCQGSTENIYRKCANTALLQCQECGVGRGTLFLFFIIILGLAILIGNILTICVWYKRNSKGKATKMDVCRSSLATADIMTGIQVLVVTVYNFSWSMNLTPFELDAQQLALRGSPQAIAAGILHTFGYTSSLYHLIYMGMERFYAILMPMKYKFQSTKSLYAGLGVAWILALAAASIPAWFSGKLVFTYLVSAFVFSVSPAALDSNQSYTEVIIALILLYLVPYVLMTVTTFAVGLLIALKSNRRTLISSNTRTSQRQTNAVYVTVAIMQLGFTITLVPVSVVIALVYTGYLNCSNLSLPYLACFYLSMSNSLINVIIYNVRDKEFRNDMVAIFKRQKSMRVSNKFSSNQATKESRL